jgi:hypothetical protein
MSRDRITMTRAEAIRLRHEEDQKRRESLVKKTIATPRSKGGPAKPKINQRPRGKPAPVKAAKPGLHSKRYDIAMSAPYGRVAAGKQTPALSMPKVAFGPRWISFLLVALCGAALYFITSDNYFVVSSANVIGNNRVSADEISSALGVMGLPAALLNPAQIEYNLLAAFPDIATARIEVNLPAEVVVTVSERQPIAAWQQDGQTVWVDAQGYAFPPRGFVEGLVTISAVSAPPVPANADLAQGIGARPFLSEEMAAALMILSPRVPQGSSLVYDPRYGLGWTDPRGWQAYFGHTHGDVNTKLQVYQGMVDYLIKRGITPKLISVEYPDAPFYRTEN